MPIRSSCASSSVNRHAPSIPAISKTCVYSARFASHSSQARHAPGLHSLTLLAFTVFFGLSFHSELREAGGSSCGSACGSRAAPDGRALVVAVVAVAMAAVAVAVTDGIEADTVGTMPPASVSLRLMSSFIMQSQMLTSSGTAAS